MKRLLILFCLIPFALFGQKTYVRTQVDGTDAILRRAADTLNPYIPYANRSALTVTTDGGIIRFYENGVELRVMAYSPIYETNYYVKTGGDDTKSGLTDEDAWAHHPWMSTWTGSTVLVAGDVVNMKRGDTWTISNPVAPYMTVAQSGSAGKPITTTAYGTGADPIIKIATASDQSVVYADAKAFITFDNLHIQHHSSTFAGDRNGFLLDGSTDPCHDFIFTNNEIDDIPYFGIRGYSDCYNITIGDKEATGTATSTAYSNHIHDFGYAGVGLEGVDPVSGHSHFDVYYNYIHDATRAVADQDEYGIYFSAISTSTSWPVYATARFNRVENINTWECLDVHGGSYIYFQDNYLKSFGANGIMCEIGTEYGLPKLGDHYYIERNIIEQPLTGWTLTTLAPAFIILYAEATGTDFISDSYITDNTMFYSSRPASGDFNGIRAGCGDGIEISGNVIYNGATVAGNAALYVTLNSGTYGNKDYTINANYINDWGRGITLEGAAITGAMTITNNIVSNAQGHHSLGILFSDLPATAAVTVYNNSFISENSVDVVFKSTFGIAAGGSFIAKNNILGCTALYGTNYWVWEGTMTGTFESDYNLYWNSSAGNAMYYNGGYRTWAYWLGTLGFDANTPNTLQSLDPLFANGSGNYSLITDFALGVGSPALDVGVNTGVTTDYYGNPRVGNYDIGAIEKQ